MENKKFISNDVFVGVFLTIVGFIFLMQAIKFPGKSVYFPTFVLLLLFILSIGLIGVGIYKTLMVRRGKKDLKNPEMKIKPFLVLGSIFVYIFCIDKIGFFVSSAIYLPCGMLLFGQRRPLLIIFSTIGLLVFIFWIFVIQMHIYMPKGFLF